MEATQDFISNYINEKNIGKRYQIECVLRPLPLGQVICLDMILIDSDGDEPKILEEKTAVLVDDILLN